MGTLKSRLTSRAKKEDSILAFIGTQIVDARITHYYSLDDQTMKKTQESEPIGLQVRISCYSVNNHTDMISIIKCLYALNETAQKLHKPLIIYANMKIEQNGYRCKKLLYQILNQYLHASDTVFIINTDQEDKAYENAAEYDMLKESSSSKEKDDETFRTSEDSPGILPRFYGDQTNAELFRAGSYLSRMQKEESSSDEKSRQTGTLYNDAFYRSIDPDEEIYIILLTEAISDPQYYEALGLRYVRLEGGFNMLHGRKGDFDRHQEIIRPQVQVDYRINILTYAPCQRDNENPMLPYYLPPEDLRYTGRGVYIGVIATDDVDYTNLALRTRDGSTRIAYIWEQTLADQGNFYYMEQINAALMSPNPEELIQLPSGESMSTAMLAVAGGWSIEAGYRGIAPETEFLVAKIKPVSEHMQRIYGGMPNPKAAIMQDAVIGMQKLISVAQQQGRPLVLLMPFNGNIDSHDGALIIQEMVSLIARRPNVTLIVPMGEEADKQHHYSIEGEQEGQRTISLRVEQPGQNIVGVIYQLGSNMLTTNLYPPPGILGGPINLKQGGVIELGNTRIYSSGERISFLNGTLRTLFRIENPVSGQWRIESSVRMGVADRTSIWISQEELNPYVKLNPYGTLNTLGSTSAIPNVMSVGAYDINTHTVLRSSGRGDMQAAHIAPTLVTYGKSIIAPCVRGEWTGISGTLPAASIMAGASAGIYQKHIEIRRFPLPNTIVMSSQIARVLRQFDTLLYPNPSQGFGVFRLSSYIELLNRLV